MRISSRIFGVTAQGETVTEFTLTNRGGVCAKILDYGAILRQLWVPDRSGGSVDIVLGYDDLSSYEKDHSTCMGAVVGRVAGRIKGAAFTLHGSTYRLEANDGANHLHGCFPHRVWAATVTGDGLRLRYHSPDGEEGFPGTVDVQLCFTLDDNNVLSMKYEAASDADTIFNLTSHSYYNLNGHDSGCADDHLLQIASDSFLEMADDSCPTGQILPTAGSMMDFTRLQRIGRGFPVACEQMELVGGYDHYFILRPEAAPAAMLYAPKTGIAMTIATTEPGVLFYSGNYLEENPLPGKGGTRYVGRGGIALETQQYPGAAAHPEFPSILLRRGHKREGTTLWQFQVLNQE